MGNASFFLKQAGSPGVSHNNHETGTQADR